MSQVLPDDYKFVSDLVFKTSGLVLGPDKQYLVETRLDSVAKKNNFKTINELIQSIRFSQNSVHIREITEALTTPETLFFRDTVPYEVLRELMLPSLLEARKATKTLRIWSAASSFGQEPYSIAMLLATYPANFTGWRLEITATDINATTLERARQGLYTDFEVSRNLPETMKAKYFKKEQSGWRISDEIKKYVQFKELNLVQPLSFMSGYFDIVFCRNVMIYFDDKTKRQVIEKIANVLTPDGYFVMGAAETMIGNNDLFLKVEGIKTGIYQKAKKP